MHSTVAALIIASGVVLLVIGLPKYIWKKLTTPGPKRSIFR